MPEMSGAEMAQRLREHDSKIRIVYMSGYIGNVTTRHKMLETGTRFMQKPFTASGMLALVGELLDGPGDSVES